MVEFYYSVEGFPLIVEEQDAFGGCALLQDLEHFGEGHFVSADASVDVERAGVGAVREVGAVESFLSDSDVTSAHGAFPDEGVEERAFLLGEAQVGGKGHFAVSSVEAIYGDVPVVQEVFDFAGTDASVADDTFDEEVTVWIFAFVAE